MFAKLLASALLIACGTTTVPAAPSDGIVYLVSGFSDGEDKPLRRFAEGTGFVVDNIGHVVTAKHMIPKEVPSGTTLVIKGTTASKHNFMYQLTPAEYVQTNVDITLLKFPRTANKSWQPLKVGDSRRL